MNRTRIAVAAVVVALALLAAVALWLRPGSAWRDSPLQAAAAEPFNIVMVVVDALRADRLPFYGHPHNTAPFLNQLAARGAVFEHAHAASTWTPSSVASLFSGLYPVQHQVYSGFMMTMRSQASDHPLLLNRLPSAARTLAESLRARGYRTFGVSSNPNFAREMGFQRGFERFELHRPKTGDFINQSVLRWKPELERAQQYFLYVHYMDAHTPYARHEPGPPAMTLDHYDRSIAYVDERIQELYAALAWHERTLLIVTADHGEEFGEHGGYQHDNTMYAELLRVPLLFSWPGVIAHRRIPDNVSLVDLLPTLEALARPQAPRTKAAGESLAGVLEGRPLPPRALFAMRRTETVDPPRELKAVIREQWKYIESLPQGRQELFDTRRDPGDRHDLSADAREVAERLRRELRAFEASARRHERAYVESERTARELSQQLRSLGYVQ